jgi:hypothetical protein
MVYIAEEVAIEAETDLMAFLYGDFRLTLKFWAILARQLDSQSNGPIKSHLFVCGRNSNGQQMITFSEFDHLSFHSKQ